MFAQPVDISQLGHFLVAQSTDFIVVPKLASIVLVGL